MSWEKFKKAWKWNKNPQIVKIKNSQIVKIRKFANSQNSQIVKIKNIIWVTLQYKKLNYIKIKLKKKLNLKLLNLINNKLKIKLI